MFWIITTNSSHVSIWNTILGGISGICQTTTKNESEEWHWVTKKFWYFFHVWLNRKGWAFFICFCIELLEKCYFVWTTQRKLASRIRKGIPALQIIPEHWAELSMLCSGFPLAFDFTHGNARMSIPLSQPVSPSPSSAPVSICPSSMSASLFPTCKQVPSVPFPK